MEKKLICPKCGGELRPTERLPRWLFCLVCGLAVSREDAAAHGAEVADGETT